MKHKSLFIICLLTAYLILLTWISHVRAPSYVPSEEEMAGQVSYLSQMLCSSETMRNEDGSVTVSGGDVLFGPYLDLQRGNYLITVETDSENPVPIMVTADTGTAVLAEPLLDREINVFPLELEVGRAQIEIVLRGTGEAFAVFAVYIVPVDEIPAGLPVLTPAASQGAEPDAALDRLTEYLPQMICGRAEMRNADGSVTLSEEGDVLFGPYIDIEPGDYILDIYVTCRETAALRVTADSGEALLLETELAGGHNEVPLHIGEQAEKLEFVCHAFHGEAVTVNSVRFGMSE